MMQKADASHQTLFFAFCCRRLLRVCVGGGGSFVDGCGSAAQPVPWRCLRLFAAGGLLLAAWRKTRLATRQGLMLWRDVRRMRPGGEGACVTTLLEMPFGAQRQNFCDAMRDLVVSPAMGVSTLEPGVVWARE